MTEEVRGEAGLVLGGLGGTAAGGQGRAEPAAREAGGGGRPYPPGAGGRPYPPGAGGSAPGGARGSSRREAGAGFSDMAGRALGYVGAEFQHSRMLSERSARWND